MWLMRLSDFDFHLPAELIAQRPLPARADSRLLYVAEGGALADERFADFARHVRAGDVVVFNDTRVLKSRLYGHKASGGRVEVLVERLEGAQYAWAFLRASHAPRPGSVLCFPGGTELEVVERREDLYLLRRTDGEDFTQLLEQHGAMPLPPYIDRPAEAIDETRYQTIYAAHPGAAAAPTAGLHFDEAMLACLDALGVVTARVTLHVGAGTFQPVRVEDIARHRMHSERYVVPQETVDAIRRARQAGRAVLAVGTTSLRALESAARGGALAAGGSETDLFITPGYRFRVVDRLLTNFHLPKSTLLMLVSAFAGVEPIRRAYAHAVAKRYRFFSYGDAMLLEKNDGL